MKEKKMLILLLAAFVALAGCYAGIEFWNAKKEEQEKAEEEAAKAGGAGCTGCCSSCGSSCGSPEA